MVAGGGVVRTCGSLSQWVHRKSCHEASLGMGSPALLHIYSSPKSQIKQDLIWVTRACWSGHISLWVAASFAVRIVSFSRWPGGSDGEEFVCNAEDPGLIPGSGRFPPPPTQEKGMATHASVLAWRIPWTEEPGRLQSTELQRVGSN